LAAALAVVGGVVAGVSVAAASETAADQTVKALASAWDKPTLAVRTGETVTWDLNSGDNQFHNVHATAGEDPEWLKVIVLPAREGTVVFTFTRPGTYRYVCDVHPPMIGEVTVTGAPVTPTATPSATPTTTATPVPSATPRPPRPQPTAAPARDERLTPAPTRSSASDRTAPTVSKLRIKGIRRGAQVRFALSEPAAVTIRVKRGKATKRTVRLAARAGTRTVNVRAAGLVKGRYAVEVEARDARGNKAAVQRKNVRVTR
jgi:plastocyanin